MGLCLAAQAAKGAGRRWLKYWVVYVALLLVKQWPPVRASLSDARELPADRVVLPGGSNSRVAAVRGALAAAGIVLAAAALLPWRSGVQP
jgi:hypothetical protein